MLSRRHLTRAQIATFLLRASGHDPDAPPSVNAAQLDGRDPSAYMTTVIADQDVPIIDLTGHTSFDTAATVATIENLSVGEHLVFGQAHAHEDPNVGTDESAVICRDLLYDDVEVARSGTAIGTHPGHVHMPSSPFAGHTRVSAGTADLALVCHATGVAGGSPRLGRSPGTQLVAVRVGDIS